MKKFLTVFIQLVLILGIISYLLLPRFILAEITDYQPYTFEKVLSDLELRNHFGIRNSSRPEDYGFKSEEVNFRSLDSTQLNGWFIRAKKPSNHCILFIHGRTSNRLKTMKYLALMDSLQLDSLYNIFIPDLRNSGKSAPTKTYMGYKFAEDVISSLQLMKKEYLQDTMVIYAFSMGAMATLNATGRIDLIEVLDKEAIVIEKIILDSPLANVKEILKVQASQVPFALFTFDDIFELYSKNINGFGENMRISWLLNPAIPTLILQSKDDELTLLAILEEELHQMDSFHNLKVVYFEGPGHVRIFQDFRTREKYIREVGSFWRTSSGSIIKNK